MSRWRAALDAVAQVVRPVRELRALRVWKLRMQVRKLRMNGLLYLGEDGQLDAFMLGHLDDDGCGWQVDRESFPSEGARLEFDVNFDTL